MTDDEPKHVGRRTLMGAATVAAATVAATVALTGDRTWAAPAIKRAIGVPTAASSTTGEVNVWWSVPAVEIVHDYDEFSSGADVWRATAILTVNNATNTDLMIAVTFTRPIAQLYLGTGDDWYTWWEDPPTATEQIWRTQNPLSAGANLSTAVQFGSRGKPVEAFAAQVVATAIPLGRFSEPSAPAPITVSYNGE